MAAATAAVQLATVVFVVGGAAALMRSSTRYGR